MFIYTSIALVLPYVCMESIPAESYLSPKMCPGKVKLAFVSNVWQHFTILLTQSSNILSLWARLYRTNGCLSPCWFSWGSLPMLPAVIKFSWGRWWEHSLYNLTLSINLVKAVERDLLRTNVRLQHTFGGRFANQNLVDSWKRENPKYIYYFNFVKTKISNCRQPRVWWFIWVLKKTSGKLCNFFSTGLKFTVPGKNTRKKKDLYSGRLCRHGPFEKDCDSWRLALMLSSMDV